MTGQGITRPTVQADDMDDFLWLIRNDPALTHSQRVTLWTLVQAGATERAQELYMEYLERKTG